MTYEEAYNAMQDGLVVSHKDFSPDEYLWMDETFIIKDENGNEYEEAWDANIAQDRFKTGWYIYKNKETIDYRKFKLLKKQKEISVNYISHTIGKPCPGKDKCLQYNKIAGETACTICDTNVVKFDKNKPIYSIEDTQDIDVIDGSAKDVHNDKVGNLLSFASTIIDKLKGGH